ncbi:MAG: hypothetical protein CVU54_09735 [Deltaproteobacteria bacterium HGW-Deltaproteobacteria-12]|jgi:hypothetical protein|nr:MAG: hypothetical protein CVU54_09735 [Deltaproteobacteria bacterium HGW-Deltaproteobacteria-12]
MVQVNISPSGVEAVLIQANSRAEEKNLYRIIPVIRKHLDKLNKDLSAEAAMKDYFKYLFDKVIRR